MTLWFGVKVWLKVVINFLFSITLIFSSLAYALFSIRKKDIVELYVTEANQGAERIIIFSGEFQPLIIHNVFWLSLAAIGFFLIFLYFIDHTLRVLLGPGVLSLTIFLFLKSALWIVSAPLLAQAGDYAAVIIQESLVRARQASLAVLLLGFLLIGLSYWEARRKAAVPGQPKS